MPLRRTLALNRIQFLHQLGNSLLHSAAVGFQLRFASTAVADAATALAFAPVYLANLVFAQRFAGVDMAGSAFAANLLGAIAGGAIEYIALITGYRFLLIVVGVLYALAFVTSRWLRPRQLS